MGGARLARVEAVGQVDLKGVEGHALGGIDSGVWRDRWRGIFRGIDSGVWRVDIGVGGPMPRYLSPPACLALVDRDGPRQLERQLRALRRLQPYVLGAATVRVGGCNRVHLDTCPLCT